MKKYINNNNNKISVSEQNKAEVETEVWRESVETKKIFRVAIVSTRRMLTQD